MAESRINSSRFTALRSVGWTYANARGIDNGRTTPNETRQCVLFHSTLTSIEFRNRLVRA